MSVDHALLGKLALQQARAGECRLFITLGIFSITLVQSGEDWSSLERQLLGC